MIWACRSTCRKVITKRQAGEGRTGGRTYAPRQIGGIEMQTRSVRLIRSIVSLAACMTLIDVRLARRVSCCQTSSCLTPTTHRSKYGLAEDSRDQVHLLTARAAFANKARQEIGYDDDAGLPLCLEEPARKRKHHFMFRSKSSDKSKEARGDDKRISSRSATLSICVRLRFLQKRNRTAMSSALLSLSVSSTMTCASKRRRCPPRRLRVCPPAVERRARIV